MKSWMLGVSEDRLVGSSSSLTSTSASESSVCVSSACSAVSCASQRLRFSSRITIMRVERALRKNLCHSLKSGVTTNLKKPAGRRKSCIGLKSYRNFYCSIGMKYGERVDDLTYQLEFWQRKWIVDRKWK